MPLECSLFETMGDSKSRMTLVSKFLRRKCSMSEHDILVLVCSFKDISGLQATDSYSGS